MLLLQSQNKYNSIVQNLFHNECNFDLATTKDKSPETYLTKDKPMSIYFFKKDKRQFDNLHLILVYVLCPRIIFILGRREYRNEQWVDSCVM